MDQTAVVACDPVCLGTFVDPTRAAQGKEFIIQFANTALAIGTACVLTRRWPRQSEVVNWIPAALVAIWVGFFGAAYLRGFHADSTRNGSRITLA